MVATACPWEVTLHLYPTTAAHMEGDIMRLLLYILLLLLTAMVFAGLGLLTIVIVIHWPGRV